MTAKWAIALAALVSAMAFCSAAAAQQTAPEAAVHDRGIVKAVEPGTGAVTLAHGGLKGFTPASETKYPVRAPEVSECLRPGDIVDFTTDAAQSVILEVRLLNYDE